MKRYIDLARHFAFSATAKDTYTLFIGNLLSAFLGFVYTLVIARALSIPEFGVFSAAVNLIVILTSVTDLGISTGAVNFVSIHFGSNKTESEKYIKASSYLRFFITLAVALVVFIFAAYVSRAFLATNDPMVAVWSGLITLSLALPMIFPQILQAQKRFLDSMIADNLLYLSRLVFLFAFIYVGGITMGNSFLAYFLGGLVGSLAGLYFVKPSFLKSAPDKVIYKSLIKFSGWIAVNRVVSSFSGRLDILMLAIMSGATQTGIYGIPARLAGFIIVLTSSFSQVLAPRMASFQDKEAERKYLVKATLATLPIVAGFILWIIIARPFIILLFGQKYIDSVFVFQILIASMIPFFLTAPSVTAIVYAMKKTVYIGAFSFFQLAAIFVLNLFFIPKYGPVGPTITFGITNTILAIYTWYIVIKHYWYSK